MIPGLYKRREKKIYIKKEKKRDFCLLLAELLHSISIMQHHNEIEDWINEGLIHYLTKILCKKCKIQYIQSEHHKYFEIWKKIHQKYGLEVLLTLLKSQDIRITKRLLNYMFNYEKDDILEISFEKSKNLLNNLD